MDNDDLMNLICEADIPDRYRHIVELIGVESFMKLCGYCMGDELYFPMSGMVLKNTRNRLIRMEFNGYNMNEISKKYDLTVKQVRNVLNSPKKPKL